LAKHQNIHLNKALGQHFLTDRVVLQEIFNAIETHCGDLPLLEVGPGAGALTELLKGKPNYKLVEYDKRWADHLTSSFVQLQNKVINEDFLQMNLDDAFMEPFAVVGNFPYNISSQIVFKIIDYKDRVPVMLGMFQREMAQRICANEGSKTYGIISVLTQLYFETTYLFDVNPDAFNPPPKVVSGVMVMKRRTIDFEVNPSFFKSVVKIAFNQRRKTLRNSLKQFLQNEELKALPIFDLRPEQLSLHAFINLTNILESKQE
jgi:16S rRNA (adenine1518-N6/adenine1519-N6)-dimethyltransferase